MTDFLIVELVRRYRKEAERVRNLADEAALPGVRDVLLSVARQYENLAEGLDEPSGITRHPW